MLFIYLLLSTHFSSDLTLYIAFRMWLLEGNIVSFSLQVIYPTSRPDYLWILGKERKVEITTPKCNSNNNTWCNTVAYFPAHQRLVQGFSAGALGHLGLANCWLGENAPMHCRTKLFWLQSLQARDAPTTMTVKNPTHISTAPLWVT